MHSTGTGQLVETQDVFFWRLAGRSAPTELAIVHWIGSINAIKTNFGNPHLTLKEGPKVKSDHTKRFPAHDFLDFGLPFQSSRTNNKRVISTFKFVYPRLTLMEGPRSNLTTAIDFQHMILCTILA